MQKENQEVIPQLTYTLILHQIRKKLGLTVMEYCVADCIYHLSNNPSSEIKGWCYISKKNLANLLGIGDSRVFEIIDKLIQEGYIEKDILTRYLRTTEKWYNSVVVARFPLSGVPIHKVDTPHPLSGVDTVRKVDTIYINNNNKNKIHSAKALEVPSQHKEVITYFFDRVKQESGSPPEINGEKDGMAVKRVLKKYKIDKVKSMIDFYLESDKIKVCGYNLSVALSTDTINRWLYEERVR